ncbi:hypothetical protein GWK08_01850 [Leptobacterium flavescens]|uniref:SGNH/GDSL hydrolase family protein n=1 Tax=Leptobacterium flavescens TaxID=472055 RepID=A0A6P0UM98_9FLAO|nr:hypothetical protein [Leptobacterium flavescens]NER12173.1 hypothetical protein [Leptobacterium flavescens]
MKKFLKKIGILLLLTLVLMQLLDWIYTYAFTHSVPRNKVQYVLQMEPQHIDYIFLGSSRVENHIISRQIEEKTGKKAINLGIQGAQLADILLMIKLLDEQKITYDKIFVQVDYNYSVKSKSGISKSYALPYISNPVIAADLEQNDKRFLYYKYIPFYRYATHDHLIGFREVAASFFKKNARIDLSDGFDAKKGEATLEEFRFPEDVPQKNEIIEEIESIVKTEDRELIFFCAPFCNMTVNEAYLDYLSGHMEGFYNYAKLFEDEQSLFWNCGHLNKEGAEAFTEKIIAQHLKS